MSFISNIIRSLPNKILLIIEKGLPDKYGEYIESIRLESYICKTYFESLEISSGKECCIENGEWNYPLCHVGFINNMLANAIDCLSRGYRPVICYKNSKGINLWEQFLVQPFTDNFTEKKRKGDRIYYKKKYAPVYFPKFPSKADIEIFSPIFKRLVMFNEETLKYFQAEYEELLRGKRVLGVLCRGTDYVANRPKGHPVQPNVEMVIEYIIENSARINTEYIYLATEEKRICDLFEEAFPGKIIVNQRCYYDEFWKLSKEYGSDVRISWVHNDRENDDFYKNLEYLSSIYLLSRCTSLIGGSCGGTQAALWMNENQYEFVHLFNLGLY